MGREYVIKNLVGDFIRKNDLNIPVDLKQAAKAVKAVIIEQNMPSSICGMVIRPFGDIKESIICVAKNQTLYRKRFTIAHEIAHIVLNHPSKNGLFVLYRKRRFIDTFDCERQANIFAAELLMPSAHLICMANNLRHDVNLLSSYYKVSKQAMKIRLDELKNYLHFPYAISSQEML